MSDKPLVIDEPVATGWLRSEYHGDQDKAKGYALAARKVLGGMRSMYGVNDRIANGEGGGFYKQAVHLPDGTRIEALTNDGHDTIKIYASSSSESSSEQFTPEFPSTSFEGEKTAFEFTPPPQSESQPKRKFREYCVWGPDREVYTPSIPVAAISMPVMDSRGLQIYAGVTLLPDYPHEVRIFDGDTLEQSGTIEIELDWAPGNDQLRRTLAVDTDSDTFIWITKGQSDGDLQTNHGFVWQAGASNARKISMDIYDPDQNGLHLISEPAVAGRLVISAHSYSGTGTFAYVSRILDFVTLEVLYSETLPDSNINQSPFMPSASVMPDGDVILQYLSGYAPFPNNFNVVHFGPGGSAYDPAGAPGEVQGNGYTMVGSNDGTLWLLTLTNGFFASQGSSWSLYRSGISGWVPIDVDGGIVFDVNDYPALLHDPVSDAVALVQSDASGIWIFNAHDCLYNPIPDFFYPIEAPPAAFAHGNAGYAGQFYDGALLLLFGSFGDFVIGRIDIGILKQTKLEEEDFS